MSVAYIKDQCNTKFICIALGMFIVMTNLLSVEGIRCHQCNSHLNEDCFDLRLTTPHAPRDNQFLKECDGNYGDAVAFCRKTVLFIAVNEERRIVRSCGWLKEKFAIGNNTCFDADNEGFMQTICTCNEDGCNGVPSRLNVIAHLQLLGVSVLLVIFIKSFIR